MKRRRLGKDGPEVSALGLGCMAMSEFYGPSDDQNSISVILDALEQGVTMLDTADTYGHGHNEELIGRAIKDWGGKDWGGEVFVATKFGIVRKKGEYERTICGRPEYVKASAEASLKRLGRDWIDLYYVHRIDEAVPIEETVGAMADLVAQGKVRYLGLSEPAVSTLTRAQAVHPMAAVQSEYSLWTRDVETELLPVLQRTGVALVAYSPLGRGALTGKLDQAALARDGDFRQFLPRFTPEHFAANMKLTKTLFALAQDKGVTPAQTALAWLLARGEMVIPIPGTRNRQYLAQNIQAADVVLTLAEIELLESVFAQGVMQGERYTPEGMAGVNK